MIENEIKPTSKTCIDCNHTFPLNENFFHKRKDSKDGYRNNCLNCQNAKTKEIEKSKYQCPKKKKKLIKQKEKIKRERAKRLQQLPSFFTKRHWEACQTFFGGHCAYCLSSDKITQDHFIPLTAKQCPGHVPWNVVPACNRCNSKKKNKMPHEFAGEGILAPIRVYLKWQLDSHYKHDMFALTDGTMK